MKLQFSSWRYFEHRILFLHLFAGFTVGFIRLWPPPVSVCGRRSIFMPSMTANTGKQDDQTRHHQQHHLFEPVVPLPVDDEGGSITRSSFLAQLARNTGTILATTTTTTTTTTATRVSAQTEQNAMMSKKGIRTKQWGAGDMPSWRRTMEESLSGSIAGIALAFTKTLIKYPLDTATVRLQMPDSKYSIRDLPALLEGSYRGVQIPLLANVPAAAVFFAVKDATKEALQPWSMPRWLSTSIAVLLAQFPYWLVRNPSEVAKTRAQVGLAGYGNATSPWQIFLQVGRDAMEGNVDAASAQNSTTFVRGYYVGYGENIIYAYPADVLKFILYEQLSGGRKNLSPAEGALTGAIATSLAQLVTTPLDVVRNRLMVESRQAVSNNTNAPSSYLDTLFDIAKNEGINGLFSGSSPRVGKALLSGAIQFATYEETKQEVQKLIRSSIPDLSNGK